MEAPGLLSHPKFQGSWNPGAHLPEERGFSGLDLRLLESLEAEAKAIMPRVPLFRIRLPDVACHLVRRVST